MENNEKSKDIMTGTVRRDALEAVICIPRTRYDDLIRAEAEREILFHAYQQMDRYDMEKVLDAVFNPQFKYREQNDA